MKILRLIVLFALLALILANSNSREKSNSGSDSDSSSEDSKDSKSKSDSKEKSHHDNNNGDLRHGHVVTCGFTTLGRLYDFSSMEHKGFKYVDPKTDDEVYVSLCHALGNSTRIGIPENCDPEASVCYKLDDEYLNGGRSGVVWNLVDDVVMATFSNGDECTDSNNATATRTTTVQISCHEHINGLKIRGIVNEDGCHAVITAESVIACDQSLPHRYLSVGRLFLGFGVIAIGIFAVACAIAITCTFLLRKRRLQLEREWEEEEVGLVRQYHQQQWDEPYGYGGDLPMIDSRWSLNGTSTDADAEFARRLHEQINRL